MPPRTSEDELREHRAKLHALETQVVLMTQALTMAREQVEENALDARRNREDILVMKTKFAVISTGIAAIVSLTVAVVARLIS